MECCIGNDWIANYIYDDQKTSVSISSGVFFPMHIFVRRVVSLEGSKIIRGEAYHFSIRKKMTAR